MTRKLILALGLAAVLGACSKDDDDPQPQPSPLTSGQWKMVSGTSVVTFFGQSDTTDIVGDMDSCERDDLYSFHLPDSININQGATKCNSNDPDNRDGGTWELKENNTKLRLNITVPGMPAPVDILTDIVTLNQTDLVIKYDGTINGFPAKLDVAFKKQ